MYRVAVDVWFVFVMQAGANKMMEEQLVNGMMLPIESAGQTVDRASESLDSMTDNLLDRAFRSSALHLANMDNTVLEKHDRLQWNRHLSGRDRSEFAEAPHAAALTDRLFNEHTFTQKPVKSMRQHGLDDVTMLGTPTHSQVAEGVIAVTEQIAARLCSNDTDVRKKAVVKLDELELCVGPAHAAVLADLAFDENPDVQRAAMSIIRRMRMQAAQAAPDYNRRSENGTMRGTLGGLLDKVTNSTAVTDCIPALQGMFSEFLKGFEGR
eukprot:gnl/TRDRNA2_/TRDRNA2_174742_c2_seq1.p1 gnl/TRDRNA2_/TRDRNA2_174742_c2~~gnl/TRDRNA2_/TRDRNA2_174742_c2_seq1.p1  ORF type:complete len:267 (+),score=44.39 gnl/TRDRNA2_/TRDRNA2_174742_c2_seq1:22-822(+)